MEVYLELIRKQKDDSADGAEGQQSRCWSTSFATVASGKFSRQCCGKWWRMEQAGRWIDAGMCRSLSCSPWKCAIKQ
jgi:hypothetical protein